MTAYKINATKDAHKTIVKMRTFSSTISNYRNNSMGVKGWYQLGSEGVGKGGSRTFQSSP